MSLVTAKDYRSYLPTSPWPWQRRKAAR